MRGPSPGPPEEEGGAEGSADLSRDEAPAVVERSQPQSDPGVPGVHVPGNMARDGSTRKRTARVMEEWRKFTPPCIQPELCMARTWGRGGDEGRGAQCTRPPKSGERFCAQHLKQQGKEGWHGAVDEEIPAKKLLEFKARGRPRTDAEVFGAEREEVAGTETAMDDPCGVQLSAGERAGSADATPLPAAAGERAVEGGDGVRASGTTGVGEAASSSAGGDGAAGAAGEGVAVHAGEGAAGAGPASSSRTAPARLPARPLARGVLSAGRRDDVEMVEQDPGAQLLEAPSVDGRAHLGYRDDCALAIDRAQVALRNVGNTCYLNALLHALATIPRVALWSAGHERLARDRPHSNCLLCKFAADIRCIRSGTPHFGGYVPQIVTSRGEWSNGRFRNTAQQDAEEAYGLLCPCLNDVDGDALGNMVPVQYMEHGGMNSTRYSTPYWSIFGGVQCSNVKCQRPGCGRESRTYDPIDRLHLELPDDGVGTTIEELLKGYFKNEPLLDQDLCPRQEAGCGYRNCRARKLSVSRWPQVLCIHLKRLVRLPPDYRYRKIVADVAFLPELVPLSGAPAYCLRSLCVHSGPAGGGHYTTYARKHRNDWYHCDDERAPRRVDAAEVFASQAYLLFYERATM